MIPELKPEINFDEFAAAVNKLDIRIGLVVSAERVPKSDKLLKLEVTFDRVGTIKQVITNLGAIYEPDYFIGLNIPFVVNLAPVKMMGQLSEAMIVASLNLDAQFEFQNYSLGTKLI